MVWWTALPLLLAPLEARAAEQQAQPAAEPISLEPPVEFSADQVAYDSSSEVITATGRVRMAREGNYLAADSVVWDRRTGAVTASGNVVVVNPEGDRLVGDKVVLTDTLRDGTLDNLLIALESGGRIAAQRATRTGNVTRLDNAVYSACPVTTPDGCPRNPSWMITAAQVIHDPAAGRVRFRGGRLRIFGVTLPLLPIFSVAAEEGATGFLPPALKISRKNGFEVALPYHWRIAPNRDVTLTPHLYTGAAPALEAKYRQLSQRGAFQASGFLAYSRIENDDLGEVAADDPSLRGYLEANGRYQLDPYWAVTGFTRLASDKTLTRRYDITRDARLRSSLNAERIAPDSYISLAGWAFQGLRVDDVQERIPIALPALDARLNLRPTLLGGRVQLQANSLAILRREGQDTQRAFGSARWDWRRLTPWGQQLTLTGFARGDLYHTDETARTEVPIYRGREGWHSRKIVAAAADLQWPLIGPLFGGIQRLTPRIQLVAAPPTVNLAIPNEDSRAVDLEDSNLFALNRFPGYDRWEDGSRVTYGAEWSYDRPSLSVSSVVGQSVRISRAAGIFPEGTGLTDRVSDIVGRTRLRYGTYFDLTHRYRLDKDDLAVRRNEIDLTFGSRETYAQIGYIRLNRNIVESVEDLRDKEELRLAGRLKFARYWSIFGATVLDLTDRDEDPLSVSDGFEPVRNRIGIAYEDDCLLLGVTWRRDYERLGEFRAGSTFALQIALKGLGR